MRTTKKQATHYILVFLILILHIITQPILTQKKIILAQNNPTNSLTITSHINITYKSTLLTSNMTTLEVLVLSPKNTTYTDTDLILSCQFNKEVTKTSYILDGIKNITFTGNIIITDLSPGNHQLIVYAQDQTGIIKASETIMFTIKPHPSTLVIISLSLVGIAGLTLIKIATKQKETKKEVQES